MLKLIKLEEDVEDGIINGYSNAKKREGYSLGIAKNGEIVLVYENKCSLSNQNPKYSNWQPIEWID